MKKIYSTCYNEQNLVNIINNLKSQPRNLNMDKDLFKIYFISGNRIKVGYGRGTSTFELNFRQLGEIEVKRLTTFNDWFLITSLVIINLVIAFLFFIDTIDGYGFTINISMSSLILFISLLLIEVLPMYFIYVTSPFKKIRKFMKKYLGAQAER